MTTSKRTIYHQNHWTSYIPSVLAFGIGCTTAVAAGIYLGNRSAPGIGWGVVVAWLVLPHAHKTVTFEEDDNSKKTVSESKDK